MFGIAGMLMALLAGILMGWSGRQKKEVKDDQRKKSVPGEKRIPVGFGIASPVNGCLDEEFEGAEKRQIRLLPSQGRVYAPAPGKIVKIFPTGNAMRLRTENGLSLLIEAGIGTRDLEGEHYRTCVICNEVVGRGKLLLEYDCEALRKEGYDPSVVITVEETDVPVEMAVMQLDHVKVGDYLVWVQV